MTLVLKPGRTGLAELETLYRDGMAAREEVLRLLDREDLLDREIMEDEEAAV